MDSAEVGVFEETDEVGFGGFLERHDGGGLESEILHPVLGDLADESLEGKLSDQKLGGLLVSSDLTESDGARSKSVRLLDGANRGGQLPGSLGGELLAGSLASSRLSGGLLGSCHLVECEVVKG